MKIRSAEELGKALRENDWVPSKTTDKTMAVMAGMGSIPWEKVKLFTLRWNTESGEIVPVINIMMHGPDYVKEEDDVEIEIDVETLLEED